MTNDIYNLQRFIDAQAESFASALSELKSGRKRSHWMWYVFPQIQGLGSSSMAQQYAISCQEEAHAYFEHPLLGGRLEQCTEIVNRLVARSAMEIFHTPDDLKFRSCMTLFARAAADPTIFDEALRKYFGGRHDPRTLDILQRQRPAAP